MQQWSSGPFFGKDRGALELDNALHPAKISRKRRAALALKRAADITFASIFFVLALPALAIIAVMIKAESPGPALFRQRRYGRDNVVFQIFKFRTMYIGHTDPDARAQTRLNDPRITRVGALIRRHSLDEVPQLLNVIRGDMSLVGPRPHALGTAVDGVPVRQLIANYDNRYRVRPGITGLAQISGLRGELSTEEKARKRVNRDLEYIDNWSLWLDCKIVFATFRRVFDDEDAY